MIIRTQYYQPIDGEKFFLQLLVKNFHFRNFNELLTSAKLTKTFREECSIKKIWDS